MNSTLLLNNEHVEKDVQEFLLGEQAKIIVLVVYATLLGLVSSMGVVSNIVNLVIFLQLVLKDSMTVQLFSLAFTDFFVSMLELTFICIYLASFLYPWSPVDLWVLAYIPFVWAVNAAYLISCWITVMISLERCVCVVLPFKVKQLFTSLRSAVIVLTIYLIHIGLFSPAFVVQKLEWIPVDFQDAPNSSEAQRWIFSVVFSESVDEIDYALDITTGLFLFLLSQLILFICSIVLSVSLKQSTAVRTKIPSTVGVVPNTKESVSHLTKQEKRLVRVVLFLSILHTGCNLPRLSLVIFYHAYPWLDLESQKNIITVVWPAMTIFSSITCSSSCFGYFRLNSKYRRILVKIFKSKHL